MEGSVILQGPIPTAGILPLVQAIGIGRQTSIVELLDGPTRIGQLAMRSGKVLSVEFGNTTGFDALAAFVSQRAGTFLVRSIHGLPPSEPIGELRTMLEQLGRGHERIALLRNLRAGSPGVRGTGVQASPPGVAQAPQRAPTPAPPAPKLASVRPSPSAPPPQPVPVAQPAPRVESIPPPKPPAVEPDASPEVPIVAVASAKGGVGKTTLAMNLAVALARRGLRVTIVDSDPNGGVSAAVNAHRRISKGAFDVVCGAASVSEALVTTRMNGLRVLPAGGTTLSIEQVENAQSHGRAWRTLLGNLARTADVVVLDTAGGVYGATRIMLGCATHVVGILQAEPLAMRASEHFQRAIAALSPAPALVGIAMNMFEPRGSTSTAVLQEACDMFEPGLLFDTAIPRTSIVNEASLRGVIAGQGDLATAPSVAWTFEQLSAELLDRLRLQRPRPALDDAPLF